MSGAVTAAVAPPLSAPRLLHLGTPGFWVGEGCFLSREPRRVGIQAVAETWMMQVPLEALDRLERDDPQTVRRVAQILMMNLDTLVRAFYELQNPSVDKRIAAALCRVVTTEGKSLPLSQTELGTMANVSRKRVNAALRRFETDGWLARGYRSVTVANIKALRRAARYDR